MLCNLVYHEVPGEPSPLGYINDLRPAEKAKVFHQLEVLQQTPIPQWPPKWVSILEDKIWELKSGDHRILFFLHTESIVVVHAVRKRARTLRRSDIKLAKRRRGDYVHEFGQD